MSLIFVVIGIWLIYRARKMKSQRNNDLANSVRTMGKVVDIETRWGSKFRSYAPEIAFKTNQNQLIRFVSPRYTNSIHHQIGQEVEVCYNPQNPNIAGIVGELHGSSTGFAVGIFLTCMGVGFFMFELLGYVILISLSLKR